MSAILRKCATKVRKNVDLVLRFVDKLSALWSSCGVCGCGDVTKMNESFVLGKNGFCDGKKEPRRVPLLITNAQRLVITNGSCSRVRVRER